MPLSKKQLTLLVQELGTKGEQVYCYLEMIALLFGEDVMIQFMNEGEIKYGVRRTRPIRKIDMKQLIMTDDLRDQLELKLSIVKRIESSIKSEIGMVKDQDLFKILKLAEISYGTQDLDVLERYLEFHR